MKETLIQFYNLDDIEIYIKKEMCYFTLHNKKYYFVKFNRTIEEFNELLKLNNEIINKKIPTGHFIINRKNSFFTKVNNSNYVLLEFDNNDIEYNILDMLDCNDKLAISAKESLLYRNNWAKLWSDKMDYFEYQIGELGLDKEVILNSFSYYEGLAENAIYYVNSTLKKYKISNNERIVLQRKRVFFPNLLINYFNPLYYVIDIEVRDIASYFKSLFFSSYDDLYIEVNAYLKRKKLSVFGYQLLYARLLYPDYYFDAYEQIIENKEREDRLIAIVNKASEYEKFLKKMYYLISYYAPIEKVDWILNKKES